MGKRYLFYTIFFFLFLGNISATGDSLNILTAQDTIFLRITQKGQKIHYHTLEKGQTLWSVSRFYGLSMDVFYSYNPVYRNKVPHPGSRLVIPVPNKAIHRKIPEGLEGKTFVPILYVAKANDTVFGMAKRYFKMPVDQFRSMNNKADNNVEVGDTFLIGWFRLSGIESNEQNPCPVKPCSLWNENQQNLYVFQAKSFKGETTIHRGKAKWFRINAGSANLVCMHRYAPKGSILKMENPMTNQTAYVKVIGKIPLNYDEWTIAVVSEDVGKALKAIDEMFFVKIEYLPSW